MSSSSTPIVNIIIDNVRFDYFSFYGAWATFAADQWFNGTVSSPTATNSSMTLTFNGNISLLRSSFTADRAILGTSAAIMGTTPSSTESQYFMVSIDNQTSVNTSFSDPNPSSYRQWYQTPNLSDGVHTITFSNLSNSSVDFAVVTVGMQTPIGGERIVVDNNDSGLNYSSGWRKDFDEFNMEGSAPVSGFPLGNSTYDTNTIGSSFSYQFSGKLAKTFLNIFFPYLSPNPGKAIAIYGLYDFSSPSLLIVSFSIDSSPLSETYRVTSTTPQFVAETGQEPNYLFYSYDFLLSEEHTLVVNVTESVNETFRFDYLTYIPTFETVSNMPSLGGGSSSSSGTGSNGRKTNSAVGIGVGVVLGSILLGVLLFLFLRHRSRRKNRTTEIIHLWGKKPTSMYRGHDLKDHWANRTLATATSPPIVNPNDSPLLSVSSPSSTQTPLLPSSLREANSIASSTPGRMAALQNASAEQYGLSLPQPNRPISTGSGPASGPSQEVIVWDTDGQTVNIDNPPSYDEVTSARPS